MIKVKILKLSLRNLGFYLAFSMSLPYEAQIYPKTKKYKTLNQK
jgi:hypothetical protein